jgi:hypothetical protein
MERRLLITQRRVEERTSVSITETDGPVGHNAVRVLTDGLTELDTNKQLTLQNDC